MPERIISWRDRVLCDGIISLFDMLDFPASEWFFIASNLTRLSMIAPDPRDSKGCEEFRHQMVELQNACNVFGLTLSSNQITTIFITLTSGTCSPPELKQLVAELLRRVHEELMAEKFQHVPRRKAEYLNLERFQVPEISEFGWNTVCEFQRAGACFAFGEDTACVFHLMRIVDAGAKSVARKLSVDISDGNWRNITGKIEKQMTAKYQEKLADWKSEEPFYADILTDITAIGKLRNRALHDYKATYSEREARELLVIVERFVRHLCQGGLSEP